MPVPISGEDPAMWLEPEVRSLLAGVPLVIAENARTARRFLASLRLGIDLDTLPIEVLDRDTPAAGLEELADHVAAAGTAVLMSEAGCPAVADPGSELVSLLHRRGIDVHPQVGPSSLLLALMGSGLSGNRFSFRGYLPVKEPERSRVLRRLEQDSARDGSTQIVMETPYRNQGFWAFLLSELSRETRLCLAYDLRGSSQIIVQKTVGRWLSEPPLTLEKRPALFLFQAPAHG